MNFITPLAQPGYCRRYAFIFDKSRLILKEVFMRIKSHFKILVIFMGLAATAFAGGVDSAWNGANDPAIFDSHYFYNLNQLPTQGFLEPSKMPWSDTYWPSREGSINQRWNQENPVGFKYDSPTRNQVLQMSKEQLAKLSPSEKYDIAMGRYDYPLRSAVSSIATPRARSWAGLCHGWAPASLVIPEPAPMEFVNPEGVVVPFGASDIKGLISYFTAYNAKFQTQQVGLRCENIGRVFNTKACNDINAASLHIILANELGIKKQGFVAEIDPGGQVWNQPVYGFDAKIIGSASPADGAYRAVQVQAYMYYGDELETPLWDAVLGTKQYKFDKKELNYYLDLDQADRIVGGRWVNKYDHPDFIWRPSEKIIFTGYATGIYKIYPQAQTNTQ